MHYITSVKSAMENGRRTPSKIPKPQGLGASAAATTKPWFDGSKTAVQRLNTLTTTASGIQGAAFIGNTLSLMTGITTAYVNAVGDEAVVFSPGDSYDIKPYYATKGHTTQFVVTLMANSVAGALSYERLTQDVGTLAPVAGQPAGGLERFNFPGYDDTDPETFPVLVYVPVVAKFPFDHKVNFIDPITGIDLAVEGYEKGAEMDAYLTSMKWLIERNGGNSLHHASGYFDPADINHAAGVHAADNLADTCDFAASMVQHPGVPVAACEQVEERIKNVIFSAINMAGVGTTTTAPGPALPQQVVQTTTQTESNQNSRNLKFQTSWRLALTGTDNNDSVVVPDLSQAFLDAYIEKSPTHASTHIQRALNDFMNSAAPALLRERGSSCSISTEEIYPYLTRQLLACEVYAGNVRTFPEKVLKEITTFCFLKSNPRCQAYEAVVKNGQTTMNAVAMSPLSTTIPATATNLYVEGKCTKLEHALNALANFEAILKFLMANPDTHESYLCSFLARAYDLIGNMTTRRTIEPITDGPQGNKYFVTNFLVDVNQAVSRIFEYAYDARVSKALANGEDLKPEYNKMVADVESIFNGMRYILTTGRFTEWEAFPRVYSYLKPEAHKNDNGSGKKPNANGGGADKEAGTPLTKKPKNQPKTGSPNSVADGNVGRQNNANTSHGVIKHKEGATGLPDIPTAIVGMNVSKGNALTKLCRANAVEGVVCKNKPCPYAHFTAKNFHARIPDVQHQKLFCDYVINSDKFDWTKSALAPRGS